MLGGDAGSPARPARHAHGHDLPGADDGAEPGHDAGRPDRRGAGDPHRAVRARPAPARAADHARRAPARARAPDRRLSAPDLGRAAPAHHDRGGAGARSRAADRRRAHHRARRHHAGADPEADARAAGAARHRRAVHHPRFRRGGRGRPPRRRHAVGARGRDGHARGHPAPAAVRLHAHADRLGAEPGAAQARAQDGAGRARHREALQDLRHQEPDFRPRSCRAGSRERRDRRAARRDGRHRRRVGLRQVHGGALRGAADRADLGGHPHRRGRRGPPSRAPPAPPPPQRADRVPGPLPFAQPSPHRRRLHRRGSGELRSGGRPRR